ncbi:hypothetical protein BGZ60DRAFT_243457 [Tricladium varicosporioides]|nr:hypothetical protein BGZ60DRAFT_243457 [Hymenoscyphus varicosporioides]
MSHELQDLRRDGGCGEAASWGILRPSTLHSQLYIIHIYLSLQSAPSPATPSPTSSSTHSFTYTFFRLSKHTFIIYQNNTSSLSNSLSLITTKMYLQLSTLSVAALATLSAALPHIFERAPRPHAFPRALSFDDSSFSFTRGGVNTRPSGTGTRITIRPTGTRPTIRPTGTGPTGRPTGTGFPTRSLPTKIVPKPTTKTGKGGPKPTTSCKESKTIKFPNGTSTIAPSFTLVSSSVTLPTVLPSITGPVTNSVAPTGITSEAPTQVTSTTPAETSTAPEEESVTDDEVTGDDNEEEDVEQKRDVKRQAVATTVRPKPTSAAPKPTAVTTIRTRTRSALKERATTNGGGGKKTQSGPKPTKSA